ncbi:ATP-binding protein [[Clostridium] colinum]|uniref:ATP-binding protein n=1 Tax=[Clostridium] colinum TaxID=36835 RepID=UPI002023C208|nr:ATP-binding protein [[Clostridium] colinum]
MYFYESNLTKDITIALAHEVKNPVSLIKANIELLELESALDNYKKNVNVIKNELNKISEIVSDFMLYCSQYYDKKEEKVNIIYLIEEYIEKFNIYNHIKFSINCFENIENMNVISDYSKISMILSNVYKNCIESISDKEGFIQTNIYTEDNKIIVDIIDNGKGIESSILEKIYEPFFTSKKGGSGLGIPICMNAMKSIDGNFEIFNNQDFGCTTRLTFKMSNN